MWDLDLLRPETDPVLLLSLLLARLLPLLLARLLARLLAWLLANEPWSRAASCRSSSASCSASCSGLNWAAGCEAVAALALPADPELVAGPRIASSTANDAHRSRSLRVMRARAPAA